MNKSITITMNWIQEEKDRIKARMKNLREQMEIAGSLDELEVYHQAHSELISVYSSVLALENKMEFISFEEDTRAKVDRVYDSTSKRLIEEVIR